MSLTLGTTQGAIHSSGTTVDTASVTISSAANRALVVGWGSGWFTTGATVSSVVFDPGGANETTLTLLTTQASANARGGIAYTLSPPAGASGIVRLTYDATPDENGFVAATPFSADGAITYEAEEGANDITDTIASDGTGLVFGVYSDGFVTTAVVSTNTTSLYTNSWGGYHSGGSAYGTTVGASTTTLAWTNADATNRNIRLAHFAEAAASGDETAEPGAGSLGLTGNAPTIVVTNHIVIEVPAGSLSVTGNAPTVEVTDTVEIEVPTGAVVLAGYEPTAQVSDHQIRAPPAGALALTGYAPTVDVSAGADHVVEPGAGSLTLTTYDTTFINSGDMRLILTGYAPTVIVSAGSHSVAPGEGSLALTGYAPTVLTPKTVAPGGGTLALTGYAPTVSVDQLPKIAEPGAGTLVLAGYAPTVTTTAHHDVEPGTGSLSLAGYAPTIIVAAVGSQVAAPAEGSLSLAGYAPTVSVSAGTVPQGPGGGGNARKRYEYGWRTTRLSDASRAGRVSQDEVDLMLQKYEDEELLEIIRRFLKIL